MDPDLTPPSPLTAHSALARPSLPAWRFTSERERLDVIDDARVSAWFDAASVDRPGISTDRIRWRQVSRYVASIIWPSAMVKRRFEIDEERLPDLPGMMLVMIEALKNLGGSATIQELDEKVIELEGVTEAEQTFTMPNENRTRVNYYPAWARTHLKRGNALVNSSRAVWALTESGAAIRGLDETGAIYVQVTQEGRERARAKRQAAKAAKPDIVESTDNGLEEAEDWKSSLLAVLGAMPPDAFERLSQRLLREAGFTKVGMRGKSGDGEIDGVGVLRVNLVSFQIYFQCKRWKGSVGAKDIRDFRGALQGAR